MFLLGCFTDLQYRFTDLQFCFTDVQFPPRYPSIYGRKRKHNRVFNKVFKRDFIKRLRAENSEEFLLLPLPKQSEKSKDGETIK